MKNSSARMLALAGCLGFTALPYAAAQMPCSTRGCVPDSSVGMGRGGSSSGSKTQIDQMPPINPDAPPPDPKLQHDQARMRNTDRQKQLVADTQKLVALANELQADVEKSNKDTLSIDVIRKADEIEKLAKSVRDKMKGP